MRSSEDNTHQILVWLDEAKRIRELEKKLSSDGGQWETYRVGNVEYDLNIDPITFSTNFGPDARIVKVDEILNEYFNLENALFTKEVLGLVFTVHELRRCEGDLIYAVSSVRPSESTRKQVRSSDPKAWNYGSYNLGSSWKQLDQYGRECSYEPIDLGQIYHAGLQVQLTFFFPKGFEPGELEQCEFELRHIDNMGNLYLKRKSLGLSTKERINPITILPLPKKEVGLVKTLEEIYSISTELEPFVALDWLTLKAKPFTDEEMEEYIKEHLTSP